jgi:hypothetical protein
METLKALSVMSETIEKHSLFPDLSLNKYKPMQLREKDSNGSKRLKSKNVSIIL